MMPITMPAMAPLERLEDGLALGFVVGLIVGGLVVEPPMPDGEELGGAEVEEEEDLVVVMKSAAW